jgi:hypothetical protein
MRRFPWSAWKKAGEEGSRAPEPSESTIPHLTGASASPGRRARSAPHLPRRLPCFARSASTPRRTVLLCAAPALPAACGLQLAGIGIGIGHRLAWGVTPIVEGRDPSYTSACSPRTASVHLPLRCRRGQSRLRRYPGIAGADQAWRIAHGSGRGWNASQVGQPVIERAKRIRAASDGWCTVAATVCKLRDARHLPPTEIGLAGCGLRSLVRILALCLG